MSDQDTTPSNEAEAPAKPAPKRKPVKKAPAKKPAAKPAAKAPAKKPAAEKPAVGGDARPAPKKDSDPSSDVIGGNAKAQLKAIKESILSLEEEKAEVAAEIKEKYAEAKSMGFDTKVLRKVIAAAKRDPKEVEEERALFDLYADAAGVYAKMES
jgi:uncharacterized protein (UPF0335 family)